MATNILQVFIENKGVSWSIGGQGKWQKYLTVIKFHLLLASIRKYVVFFFSFPIFLRSLIQICTDIHYQMAFL